MFSVNMRFADAIDGRSVRIWISDREPTASWGADSPMTFLLRVVLALLTAIGGAFRASLRPRASLVAAGDDRTPRYWDAC